MILLEDPGNLQDAIEGRQAGETRPDLCEPPSTKKIRTFPEYKKGSIKGDQKTKETLKDTASEGNKEHGDIFK